MMDRGIAMRTVVNVNDGLDGWMLCAVGWSRWGWGQGSDVGWQEGEEMAVTVWSTPNGPRATNFL